MARALWVTSLFKCRVCRYQDDYFYSKRPVSPLSPPSNILELTKHSVKAQHAEKYHTPPEKDNDSTAQQVLKITLKRHMFLLHLFISLLSHGLNYKEFLRLYKCSTFHFSADFKNFYFYLKCFKFHRECFML